MYKSFCSCSRIILPELYFYVLYQLHICVLLFFIADNIDIFIAQETGKGVNNE